ncbi:hypothetical protein MCOR27_002147 [Pyricularia oryzae]|uniref:Copper transport protein n=5 Tax=Pyricularia TaxID=48558 RepID=A0ABQ8NKG9_PYRGI|nr:uncharacterized protein MGG_09417 [Pyricularia oryzae 70-15]ELQ44080.1 hypothetical protein OOU_Y34scaffold00102g2 [Pyricularia oryzae Y34]KAH8846294.1 hypothetical protein MCOR01_003495 [Pyricularia oryzae]KAI6298407.1 hypothetical protein MCOR33_005480 [Pyricularia grisea]EHA47820.1 hypothetical protein MGG_09417 [Pyricularia oryzae 70-15]KAH9432197.1 hypothetical protein MCOR02_006902 [Pyricularia oryzae]
MMVFHASTTTPLYLSGWQPISAGQYAGTCIFLIVLGTFTRITLALKPVLEARRWRPASHAKSASTEHHEVRRGGISWLATVERALYDVLVAALGYLLMLAVMTMNIGYCISVLGGVFFGSLVAVVWTSEHDGDWLPC